MNQTKGCLLSKFSIRIFILHKASYFSLSFLHLLNRIYDSSLQIHWDHCLGRKISPTRNRLIRKTPPKNEVLFVVELLIRIGADGRNFFKGDEKWWTLGLFGVKGVQPPDVRSWYRMSMDSDYPFLQIGCLRSVNRWNKPILRTSYDHFLGHRTVIYSSSWCSPCLVRTEMERFGATGSVKSLHNKEHIRLRSISTSQHV